MSTAFARSRPGQWSVRSNHGLTGEIGRGLLILLGVAKEDSEKEALYILDKILNLRIFEDAEDKMNLSLLDIAGELLVVSQFTLYGDTRRGRRPSFDAAAAPELAEPAYLAVCQALRGLGLRVATGRFRAMMEVHAVVAGPVTILLDSEKQF